MNSTKLYKVIKEDYTDSIIQAVEDGSNSSVIVLADLVERTMQEKCPVVSGDLKRSIFNIPTTEKNGTTGAEVGAGGTTETNPYIRIIEYTQHPFMRTAGLAAKRIARKIVTENQFDAVLKGKARGKRKK
jgi:hypothetical protein